MTTAAVIESRVATAMKVPANAREDSADPLPLTTSELINVPDRRKTIPSAENFLAAVDEKYVTQRIIVSGLMHHQGSDPGPPGFASKARFGPPPGSAKPISPHK